MSIIAQNLTKVYGDQKAVDDASFEVKPGEIVGFLGPNGAGKTTTMKMLTCFIPPTSGNATVAGYDIHEESIPLRKKVGYLPEHNPLYLDMFVKEYLTFVAKVHQISDVRVRIKEMIELTGLSREQHKPLSALSKGYRQRVGLAQAMIHEPEVLILDEPTAGLDPNQLVEIRQLIRSLGRDKTVLFSTHIMQEVQALCDRVIIISKGKMVADEPIEVLGDRLQKTTVCKCGFLEDLSKKDFAGLKGLQRATKNQKLWELTFEGKSDPRAEVFEWAKRKGVTLVHLEKVASSLEDVFQKLTKEQ
jgi:ABC-2 type transport system ATP-binding protein